MRLLKNLRVRLAKNPVCAGNYECNNSETNPESPKPKWMPPQLRFCASDLFFQITAFSFKFPNPVNVFGQFLLQRLTL